MGERTRTEQNGVGITDELRKYADELDMIAAMKSEHGMSPVAIRLKSIADRIDKEHAKAVERARMDGMDATFGDGWAKLPVDADGVPIHVGDELADEKDRHVKVRVLKLRESGWLFDSSPDGGGMSPAPFRHVQPDTWERIIEDALTVGWPNGDWSEVASAEIHDRLVERCRRLADGI